MEFRFRSLVRRFEAFRSKASDHSKAIRRTRRDAARSGGLFWRYHQSRSTVPKDGHGQFSLSGGPRIDVLNGGAQGMAKTNGHRARQTPETGQWLPAGQAKLAVPNTRTSP